MSGPGFRLDRALTTGVFHPLRRVLGGAGSRLPILMYHGVSDDPENGFSPYYKVKTSPAVFREQMGLLAERGYRTMDLAEVARLLARGEAPAPKSVVITFDDGFRDFQTAAFPVLQHYGLTATVFLPTAFIQEERRRFKEVECLTWKEVRELRGAGIEFGSHTVNHPKLAEMAWREVGREVRDSKEQMEQALGEAVTTFAYPFAFPQGDRLFVAALRGLLAEAGYTCCATTEIGRVKAGDDPFRLKRLPANGLDDPAFFQAKVEGGYDWLGWPQAMIKKCKGRTSSERKGSAGAVQTGAIL